MKTVNVQTKGGKRFSTYCREVIVSQLKDLELDSASRGLEVNMYYPNLSLLEQRLGRANRLLANYDFVEPVELVTDSKLLAGGPSLSARNGFYLDMGNLGEYLPVLHGILGYLRGGKTLELALAKASLQAFEVIDYDRTREMRLPFNGSQSFLENIWPGIWAEEFTETIKRYKKPGLHIFFASVWAGYMGFTAETTPTLPWGFVKIDEIAVDEGKFKSSFEKTIPTYFMNCVRCVGTLRDGSSISAMMPWTALTEPMRLSVYVYPDEIWQQIPFIGKPEGE